VSPQGIPCNIPVNKFLENGLNKAVFYFTKSSQGIEKEYRLNDKTNIEDKIIINFHESKQFLYI